MILSDGSIRKMCLEHNLINPYCEENLQPASYDLTLGDIYGYPAGILILKTRQFILASTEEYVNITPTLVGRIEGKSTLARQGLIIHTAGFVDPCFHGQLTLEITNLGPDSIPLEKGMKIAQIAFCLLDKPVERGYGSPGLNSHYQFQQNATPAFRDTKK